MLPWLLAGTLCASASTTFEGYTFYVGDPHHHIGLSGDGQSRDLGGCGAPECGAIAEVFEIARDNGLDWLSVTDHVNAEFGAETLAWEEFLGRTLAHDDDDGLVVIPGAELTLATGERRFGHRNVYLFGADDELDGLRWEDVLPSKKGEDLEDCEAVASWLDALGQERGPVLLVPHHTNVTMPMATDFECWDPEHEVVAEVYSSWGNHLGGSLAWWDTPAAGILPPGSAIEAMDPDFLALRFGFMAGSDVHVTMPGDLCLAIPAGHVSTGGLTVLALPEGEPFDRAAVYEALVEHRSYATTGPAVPAVVEYRSGGELLGGLGEDVELRWDEPLEIELRIPPDQAPWVIEVSAVTPDGQVLMEPADEGTWGVGFEAEAVPPWVFVAVQMEPIGGCDDDGGADDFEWLFLSPSWFDIEAPQDTGATGDSDEPSDSAEPEDPPQGEADGRCGCAAPASLGWLLALLAIPAIRRRR